MTNLSLTENALRPKTKILCNHVITSETHLCNNIVLHFFPINIIFTSNDKLGHFRVICAHSYTHVSEYYFVL